MAPISKQICLILITSVVWQIVHCKKPLNQFAQGKKGDFIHQGLDDGTHELLLHLKRAVLKQTFVTSQQGIDGGLALLQMTDGKVLVQFIMSGFGDDPTKLLNDDKLLSNISDCRITRSNFDIETLLNEFQRDNHGDGDTLVGFLGIDNETQSVEYIQRLSSINFRTLWNQCRQYRKQMRNELKNKTNKEEIVDDKRVRRSMRQSYFIMPGTKWCGNSNIANTFGDLSGSIGADRCCRNHDKCPYSVGGLSKGYGLYNYWLTTVSLCECDERFRSCLKTVNTDASKMVGRIFFDILKTRCFNIKRQRSCKRWSSNSKCQEWRYQKRAVLRNPMNFLD